MQSKASSTQKFPCLNCGARLEFDPKTGHLECPYCGQEKLISQGSGSLIEHSYGSYLAANHTQIAALSTTALEVKCPGCSAQFAFEPPTIAGQCPFCSTSIVGHPHTASPIEAPEAVLPFRVDQRTAKENVRQWLRRRWFAPTGLHKLSQQANIQGIYLPFWTYDCQTSSQYRGERGDHYTVTETYTETDSDGNTETKTRDVQRTRWTSVSGHVSRQFDDVLVAGTESVNSEHLNAVSNWDLSSLVAYDASYLAGFKAQRYQINLKAGFEQAKVQMAVQIHSDVEQDIGGDEQRVSSVSTSHTGVTFKHILLPVWVTSYRFKNRQYSVMVNAQTGKVAGDRPFSRLKISLAVLAVSAIAGLFIAKVYFNNPAPPADQSPGIDLPASNQPEPVTLPGSSTAPGSLPSPSSAPSEAFRQAIALAQTAVSRGQQAKTSQDWRQIASLWEQAIIAMTKVPSSSSNHAIAQQKVTEYQQYLNYARQQVRNAAP